MLSLASAFSDGSYWSWGLLVWSATSDCSAACSSVGLAAPSLRGAMVTSVPGPAVGPVTVFRSAFGIGAASVLAGAASAAVVGAADEQTGQGICAFVVLTSSHGDRGEGGERAGKGLRILAPVTGREAHAAHAHRRR